MLSEEYDSKIIDAVISNLEKFGKEKYERGRAKRLTPQEQRQFIKQHFGVSVEKGYAEELLIRPLHHERGGFVASDHDAIVLRQKDLPHKLADAITEAFQKAT